VAVEFAMTDVIARILVPVDFSPHTTRVIEYAISLASRLNAEIEFFNVVEDPFQTGAWPTEIQVTAYAELMDGFVEQARGHLRPLRKRAAERGVEAHTSVLIGRPATAILDHAIAGHFDLIVMGTHGRTGIRHAVIGSVAERVVRRSECPVLTVRHAPPAAGATTPE
jgi:nucleotide-binding universal stress UspA family protein